MLTQTLNISYGDINVEVTCLNFSVSKDMEKCFRGREVTIEKVAAHLYLTLIVKELIISVEQGRVVTTLNMIKH